MDDLKAFYKNDEYIKKNPSIHKEDSKWKFEKIIPQLDLFISNYNRSEINILDVGGGAGLILKQVSEYFKKKQIKVNKFILDLSPKMLMIQSKNNPNVKLSLNESIDKTSLKNKQIDLTLMIDVLEHLEQPEIALEELKRISKYVIFKIPLEDNIFFNFINIISNGEVKKNNKEIVGHIQYYNVSKVKKLLKNYCGEILLLNFADSFDRAMKSNNWTKMNLLDKIQKITGAKLMKISPYLSTKLFGDHVLILVKC